MLAPLSRATIDELLAPRRGPCLSIYLPTHRFGPEAAHDHVVLERLLDEARHEVALGHPRVDTRKLLRPVVDLLRDADLWRHSQDGLAIFVAPTWLRVVRAELPFDPAVSVGERFSISPLVAALPPIETFYVLAVSRNAVRLLEVTPDATSRVDLPDLPRSMEHALGYAQYYSETQVHSAGPRSLGRRAGVVHGHGDRDEERLEKDLLAYFRKIATALRRLPDGEAPIVLATVEEYVPLFHRVANEARLAPVSVAGNPDALSDGELANRARQLIDEETGRKRIDVALARYRALSARQRTTSDQREIIAAADQGRVDTLLVAPGGHRWGHYEPDLCRVTLHAEREPGDQDLVDLAVARTLEQGGEVIAVTPPDALAGVTMTAIMRY